MTDSQIIRLILTLVIILVLFAAYDTLYIYHLNQILPLIGGTQNA